MRGYLQLAYPMLAVVVTSLGCSCNSKVNDKSSDPPRALRADKTEAFRLIVVEVKKLPTSEEYYRDMPKEPREKMLQQVARRVSFIEGMVEVFRIIEFDAASNPDDVTEMRKLFESVVRDWYREPYARLLREIEDMLDQMGSK